MSDSGIELLVKCLAMQAVVFVVWIIYLNLNKKNK